MSTLKEALSQRKKRAFTVNKKGFLDPATTTRFKQINFTSANVQFANIGLGLNVIRLTEICYWLYT